MPASAPRKTLSPQVADYMAKKIVGTGDEIIQSLTFMKKEPEKARKFVAEMLGRLATWAAYETGELVIVERSESVAQEVIDHCFALFAKEAASIT